MRPNRLLQALGGTLRVIERELASRLLVAAMFIPLVEALFGWHPHTPLEVSLAVHASVLIAMVVLAPALAPDEREDARMPRGVRWLPVPLLAVVLTVLLNARSNIFYTGRALIEGLALLFAIHFARCWLRELVLTRHRVSLVSSDWTRISRLRVWWNPRVSVVAAPSTPAVRVADSLGSVVGWALLLSWLLIAFAHRHVVGPILILAGALEFLALLVMIPDGLPFSEWAAWVRVRRARRHLTRNRMSLIRGGIHSRPRYAGPHFRRRT